MSFSKHTATTRNFTTLLSIREQPGPTPGEPENDRNLDFKKELMLATFPAVVAILVQKILDEGFGYISSKLGAAAIQESKKSNNVCSSCTCNNNKQKPTTSTEPNTAQENKLLLFKGMNEP